MLPSSKVVVSFRGVADCGQLPLLSPAAFTSAAQATLGSKGPDLGPFPLRRWREGRRKRVLTPAIKTPKPRGYGQPSRPALFTRCASENQEPKQAQYIYQTGSFNGRCSTLFLSTLSSLEDTGREQQQQHHNASAKTEPHSCTASLSSPRRASGHPGDRRDWPKGCRRSSTLAQLALPRLNDKI